MEDNYRLKMTLDGRRPWMEDDLGRKTSLDGKRHWMEDNLGWKMTLDGRERDGSLGSNQYDYDLRVSAPPPHKRFFEKMENCQAQPKPKPRLGSIQRTTRPPPTG